MSAEPNDQKGSGQNEVPQTSNEVGKAVVSAEDSDPDFDDLDDVLDQFSANVPKATPSTSTPAPSTEPGIPPQSQAASTRSEPTVPSGLKPDETENEFITRLSAEMSSMLSSLGNAPTDSTRSPEDLAKMGAELEAFTHKMEAEGIKPEDLLKAILGDEEGTKLAESARQDAKADAKTAATAAPPAAAAAATGASTAVTADTKGDSKPGSSSFEDTIRRTMSRLDKSNSEATNATAQSSSKSEEDMFAEMLKAMEAGGEGGEDGLSKMFLDMMHQLTHKEMLYDPMKDLDAQYPSWLEAHKPPKLSQSEYDRYSRQSTIVAEIIRKFEEPGFNDDDPTCREYIWDRMQQMQGEGAPPEELVKSPFPGSDFTSIPGLGGGGEGLEGLEEGCPTQ